MNRSIRSLRLLSFVIGAPLCAQGLLIGPAPVPQPGEPVIEAPRGAAVRIVRTAIAADIVDGVATTTIDGWSLCTSLSHSLQSAWRAVGHGSREQTRSLSRAALSSPRFLSCWPDV